jgi:hypothetical protein
MEVKRSTVRDAAIGTNTNRFGDQTKTIKWRDLLKTSSGF